MVPTQLLDFEVGSRRVSKPADTPQKGLSRQQQWHQLSCWTLMLILRSWVTKPWGSTGIEPITHNPPWWPVTIV